MKNKLMYLSKLSLNRKIKSKWFIVANILLALGIILVANIDSVINMFGGDFNEPTTIYVYDNTESTYDLFIENIETSLESYYGEDTNHIYEKLDTIEGIEETLNEEENNILFVINSDEENIISVDVESKTYIDSIDYQLYVMAINNTKSVITLDYVNISESDLNKLYSTATINRIILDEDAKSADEQMQMIMTTAFPIVILPFFMLVIFLIQMVGTEINDEKTTKSMEIIISNVSPKTHLLSKIIASNIFVIGQGLLLFIYGGIGLLIRKITSGGTLLPETGIDLSSVISSVTETGLASKLVYIIPLTLILMIITFLAYSLLSGILASMTTNAEDFQQLQTPMMLITLAGYYLSIMAGLFEGATFIRVLSYFPLISAILSPSLLVLGDIGIIDVLISIVIMIGFIILLIKYGLKIYKVGILNYSSKDLWKKMFKAIKED